MSEPGADPPEPDTGARRGNPRRSRGQRVFTGADDSGGNGFLKISELAERSGVPVATVRHYLREGLLPEPVKTSRNMAYYPPAFVERIRVIKQLQEERFMPLRVIRDLLDRQEAEPERLRAMIELEDRILERALAGEEERISAEEVRSRYDVPKEVLDRLAALGVLTPDENGYSPSDVRIVEAISRFRAGGYDERLGFTVYDTLRYKQALEPLVAEEVEVLTQRLAGDLDPDRAVELIEAGAQPLNDLIAALTPAPARGGELSGPGPRPPTARTGALTPSSWWPSWSATGPVATEPAPAARWAEFLTLWRTRPGVGDVGRISYAMDNLFGPPG